MVDPDQAVELLNFDEELLNTGEEDEDPLVEWW